MIFITISSKLFLAIVVNDSSDDEDEPEVFPTVLYEEWEDTAKYSQCTRNHQRFLNKYDGRTLTDEVQEGRKVVIEKRVVTGVIWIEDEPGYDAPQYVLKTDMLDRAQRSEASVENYLISVETLQTMILNVDEEIANANMSTAFAIDESNKENTVVPAWARNINLKNTGNSTVVAAAGGKKKKKGAFSGWGC